MQPRRVIVARVAWAGAYDAAVQLAAPAKVGVVQASTTRGNTVADRDEVMAKVHEILVERLDIAEADITETAHLRDDLKADSLDLVELIMDLEESFGVKISDEDAQSINTVGEAVDLIVARAD